MKRVIGVFFMVSLVAPVFAEDFLTGTPYTVIYRGAAAPDVATQRARIPNTYNPYLRQAPAYVQQTPGVLRLVDVRARREVARAAYDGRLGGYMFQLPFADTEPRGQRCLALLDARNQYVLVRQPSSVEDGTSFRNAAWESELGRTSELAALKSERSMVEVQSQSAAVEVAKLQTETGLPPGSSAAQCPIPPRQPDPARPQSALEAAEVAAVAGPACALKWEREYGSRGNLASLFVDSGASGDWQGRSRAAGFVDGMPGLRIPISSPDLALVLEAAAKGKTHLEHGDGLRVFSRANAACRAEVDRQVSAIRQGWERSIEDARQAPERSRQECAQRIARIAQLNAAQAAAPSYLAALDRRIAQQSAAPPIGDAAALNAQLCQP